jgi:hypothetical protein
MGRCKDAWIEKCNNELSEPEVKTMFCYFCDSDAYNEWESACRSKWSEWEFRIQKVVGDLTYRLTELPSGKTKSGKFNTPYSYAAIVKTTLDQSEFSSAGLEPPCWKYG